MGNDRVESELFSHDKPSPARMYDYFLGGYNNFEADRTAARKVMEINPDTSLVMRTNRAFLRRVVTFLVEQGIDQFLDLGSGIPTAGNVHEVAQNVNPETRVVYVDADPVAVHYSKELLKDNPRAAVLKSDARRPEHIFEDPEVRQLLDFDRPVGVLLLCLLHFVSDDEEAYGMVRTLKEALAPGSFVGISHATHDAISQEHGTQVKGVYSRTATPLQMRSYEQIGRFFEGLELVEPGVVWVPTWKPENSEHPFANQPDRSITYGGVGRKA